MLPLRFAARWRSASIVLLLFVLAAALSPVFWFWDDKAGGLRWFENTDKWLHGMTFFVLTVWFSGMFPKRRYALMALGLLGFGLVIEACQYSVSYRTADWFDVGANATGIIIGMAIAFAGAGGWCQRVEERWSA